MRAMTVTAFGGPDVFELRETPDPEPGPGEVLVAVGAVSVLWLETRVRSGQGRDHWPMRPPYVPGNGVTGTVLATGEGVDPSWAGRRVAARTGGEGGYADRLVTSARTLSPVPEGVDLATAAAVLHDGATALGLFDSTKIGASDDVVVLGASGGLGLLCVQLARARGGSVVALARGADKLARIRDLQPDAAVDLDDPDWLAVTREALPGGGADVVLDHVGGTVGDAAFALLRTGGRFSAHGTPSGRFAAPDPAEVERRDIAVHTISRVQYDPDERTRYTTAAMRAVADGEFTPVVGQTFPLAEAGAAHAAIEARTVFGKTVLTV